MTKARKTVRKAPTRAAITGVFGYVPPDVLSNAELAQMVDTSDEWIVERTGIKERRILKGRGLGTSHLGAEAVRGLLKKTGTAVSDVELLICATTTPDFVFPSSANLICDMVGIRGIGTPWPTSAAASGAATRPTMKVSRQRRSWVRGFTSPSAMPLMPAMRPLNNIKSTAASPINAPPIAADMGVKFSMRTLFEFADFSPRTFCD